MSKRALFPIRHASIKRVEATIFTVTFVADCMTHGCRVEAEAGARLDDACCRFGCDVDLHEKAAILGRAAAVARVMPAARRDPAGWFDESEPELEADSPSGVLVRTARKEMAREDGLCVFLQEGAAGRGCALHRAAVEGGFEPAEIKPLVCRMYPLSLEEGVLCLADDFEWYSCARHEGPTLYRVMRDTLAAAFGSELIAELDAAEQSVAGGGARPRLRVIA